MNMESEHGKLKLTIELVPSTVWYSSIYQIYRKANCLDEWRRIKRELFEKEGQRCWICEKEGGRLEAHEFWEYDDENHIQRLAAIHHLCSMCHKIKHMGFWCHSDQGREQLATADLTKEDLISHFCKVNECSTETFEEHEQKAFDVWEERSKHSWKQDFGKYHPKRNQHTRPLFS